MKRLAFFAFFALTGLFMTSCELLEEPTAAEVFQSKTWKLNIVKENGTAVVMSTCTTDDKFSYKETGSYEHNYGTDKCFGDPNTTSGNWNVENNDQTLKIVTTTLGINRTSSYTIKSFSSKEFVLTYETTSLGGAVKTIEETYIPAQ